VKTELLIMNIVFLYC